MSNTKPLNTLELDIEGMDCPSCASKIEKTVCKLDNIQSVKVNLGNETASITFKNGNQDIAQIKDTINKLGYKAFELNRDEEGEEIEKQKLFFLKRIRLKVIVSIVLSLIVVALGMKHHIGLHTLTDSFANWISLPLSTIVVFWCGSKFLKGFWNALKAGTSDMDTLITIGTLAAYIYSVAIMFIPSLASEHDHTVYFESAAMIITFILLGNYLEAKLKSKTQYAVKSLMDLQAKTATVIRNGQEVILPLKKVKVNDIVLVKPGERIPVDGIVTEGSSSVDESMVTGESMPSDKTIESVVIGGTTNLNGYLKIKTGKVGKDTFLAKIINLVRDAQKSKPHIQRLGDKVSAVFVPIVIIIAIGTFIAWNYFFNQTFSYSLLKAAAVLIIACPCALGLATPIAIVLGVGKAAENKILFNNAEAIENVSKVDTIVFDKTGTLTYAKFNVKEVIPHNSNYDTNEILKLAASIENFSEHPIARSIVNHYLTQNNSKELYNISGFNTTTGIGVEASINNTNYSIGGAGLLNKYNSNFIITDTKKNIYLFEDTNLIGEISITDKIKENAKQTLNSLRQDNFELALISGDGESSVKETADELGIINYHYQILPDKKLQIIDGLQKQNKFVAMVGDGINDAPSLSKADIGIAIGTGQDIALQSADVILVNGDLQNLDALFKISGKTIRIIKQNLFWAFFYNVAAIPLAAGIFVSWGISISPVMASMLMAFSDVITVLFNSMRIKYMKLNKDY